MLSACSRVRESAVAIAAASSSVSIIHSCIPGVADSIVKEVADVGEIHWDDSHWHYADDTELTAQYCFVLDALNFCFWPSETELEYDTLATVLKTLLENDSNAFSAARLKEVSSDDIVSWFQPHNIPNAEERARKLNELGTILEDKFGGFALNVVEAAGNSAAELVNLIVGHFSGFQDHSVYKGRQVYFYKRAQILTGDIWAAYGKGKLGPSHPASFHDIHELTMFADYRVPQLLRAYGVLKYAEELEKTIDNKQEIPFGHEWENEIRGCTVHAVELLKRALEERGCRLSSVEIDWYLWQTGEKARKELKPHHRTLTVYY